MAFLFYPFPSSFCLFLSLVCRGQKSPAPFFFFFDFFPSFGRDHGSSVKRQSSPATVQKKKNQDDSFFGLVFSAFVSSNPLVFGLCAEKFHRDEKPYSHALQLQEKCLSQFPPLLAPESSPRRTSRPPLGGLPQSRGKRLL